MDTGSHGAIITNSDTFKLCYSTSHGSIFKLPIGFTITDTSSTFQ